MSKTVKTVAPRRRAHTVPVATYRFLHRIARNKRPPAHIRNRVRVRCKVRSFETRPCGTKIEMSIKEEMSDQTASNRINIPILPPKGLYPRRRSRVSVLYPMGRHRYARAIIIREGVVLLCILVSPKQHIRCTLVLWWLSIIGRWALWR